MEREVGGKGGEAGWIKGVVWVVGGLGMGRGASGEERELRWSGGWARGEGVDGRGVAHQRLRRARRTGAVGGAAGGAAKSVGGDEAAAARRDNAVHGRRSGVVVARGR